MNQITRFHYLLPVALTLLSGCGDSGLDKAVVSGKVSYQGEPVQDGLLRFVPIEDTKGPASGAVIRDGVYTGPGNAMAVSWADTSDAQGQSQTPPATTPPATSSGTVPAAIPGTVPPTTP